jgi:predicted component of type VI protein secretion system
MADTDAAALRRKIAAIIDRVETRIEATYVRINRSRRWDGPKVAMSAVVKKEPAPGPKNSS